MTEIALREATEIAFDEWDALPPSTWVRVDQMLSPGRLFTSHYLCRRCAANLSALTLSQVAVCPYCAAELDWWPHADIPKLEWAGSWPFQLWHESVCLRIVAPRGHPCTWQGMPADPIWTVNEQGNRTTMLSRCRRRKDHLGEHDFGGPHD
jgi:hypothetical protein